MIKFIEKEQNWQNEQTRYWFDVDGAEFCIVEAGPSVDVLDSQGAPLLHGQTRDELLRKLVVTDEMRAE